MSNLRTLLLASLLTLVACQVDPLDGVDVEAAGRLAGEIEREPLLADLEALVSAHVAEPPLGCAALPPQASFDFCTLTHTRARAYIEEQLSLAGLEPQRQTTADGALTTVNIFADLRGGAKPSEVVLIGAHYDVLFSAADDNGTGVAALLQIARAAADERFDRTLRFVFFDLEELGLVGSTRYVDALLGSSERLVAALVLDMIGYRSTAAGSQQLPIGFTGPEVADFLALIGNDDSGGLVEQAYALNQRLGLIRLEGVITGASGSPLTLDLARSDHAPFWLERLPAMLLTDTGPFRNDHYHSSTDTVGTIDGDFFHAGARLSAALMAMWAGGPR